MEGNPTAGENFRHPAPHECRLAMTGIPCKTSIVTEGSLVSDGALNSGGASVPDCVLSTECRVLSSSSPCSLSPHCPCSCVSEIVTEKSVGNEPKASGEYKGECCRTFGLDFQRFPTAHVDERQPYDDHHNVDDTQRVLDIGEDSSSDESYIGQTNVLASFSSEEDHDPVVFAPLEVGDPFAGLARATSGHSDSDKNMFVDDARMDSLVQKAFEE